MKKIVLTMILIMSLAACHPSGKEVAGKYYAEHGKGTEYIDMKANGTFVQYFKNDTTEKSNRGTWKFDYNHGQLKLELTGYVIYVLPGNSSNNELGRKGYASFYWEKNEIIVYPDLDEYNYYRKK